MASESGIACPHEFWMGSGAPGCLVIKPPVEAVAAEIDIGVLAVLTTPNPGPVRRAPERGPGREIACHRTEQNALLVPVIAHGHPQAVGIRRMIVGRMRAAVGGVYPTGEG